jgi:hypothetical protein
MGAVLLAALAMLVQIHRCALDRAQPDDMAGAEEQRTVRATAFVYQEHTAKLVLCRVPTAPQGGIKV